VKSDDRASGWAREFERHVLSLSERRPDDDVFVRLPIGIRAPADGLDA
jgi:hypothetical protein